MSITPGTVLGPYEITAQIGAGGMGEVYRAHDRKLNRDVALKILPEAFTNDPDRLARFSREAHLLAALNHPHVGAIYGFEDGAAIRALVLELVEGETLADRIARGPIPLHEALPIARQIADALQAAHDQGIVHRDLKPSNIKVTPDDVVKVLDFGLAKLGVPERPASHADLTLSPTITSPALMTTAGVVLGTAAYMSPEQAKGREADKRSDVWAFGCVLYEMLTGQRAFDGEDMTDVLGAVVRLDPDWQRLPADVPPALRTLLQQCLVKDRKRRVADIAAVRFVLDHQAAFAGAAPPASRGNRRSWLRAAAMSAAVIAAAAAGGAMVWFMNRPQPPRVVRSTITTSPSTEVSVSSLGRVVAITPDGSRVVYQGENQLFVRPLNGQPATLVRGVFRSLFISPDSHWVGFFDRGVIKRVSITGGAIESVVSVQGDGAGASWASDGTLVFATAAPGQGLQRLSAGGSTSTDLTKLTPEERDHILPEFLPDGTAVLFTIVPATGGVDNRIIALVDLRTGVTKRLFRGSHPQYVSTGHLVYTVDGTLRAVAFDLERREPLGQSELVLDGVATTRVGVAQAGISADGSLVYVPGVAAAQRTLALMDRTGKSTPLPNLSPDTYRQVRVSPDGRRIAANAGGDIRIYDFDRSTPSTLTTDRVAETHPLWSLDGQRIFYTSFRDGPPQIFSRAADGTGSATLVLTRGKDLTNLVASAWASAKELIFMEVSNDLRLRMGRLNLDRPADVTMLPIDGGRPSISPYGIAYESNASGQSEIFVERFPQLGNRETIAVGRDPRWSLDGRELFFVREDGRQLFSAKVQPGLVPRLGRPEVVANTSIIPTQGGDAGYDVTANGFVVIQNEAAGSAADTRPTIELIQNWGEELKRLVPLN